MLEGNESWYFYIHDGYMINDKYEQNKKKFKTFATFLERYSVLPEFEHIALFNDISFLRNNVKLITLVE